MAKKLKLKTHSGASKRFKINSNGTIKHKPSFKNHILTKKSAKRKRDLRGLKVVSPSDVKAIKQMFAALGY